jgi:hypothetical protein
LIVVEVRGVCDTHAAEQPAATAAQSYALASSSVVDGRVLPFSWVDCSALSRFIGPSLAEKRGRKRDYIYGRAMARLLAHEFYHVLAQTEEHTAAGLTKPKFSVNDLLADRFEYEETALSRLRGQPAEVAQAPSRAEQAAEHEDFAGR